MVSFALIVTANKLYQHSKYATTCLTDSKSTDLLRSKWVKWNQCQIWPVIVVSFMLIVTASKLYQHSKCATCLTDSKSTDLLRSKWVKWNQCHIWPVIVVSFVFVVTASNLYQNLQNMQQPAWQTQKQRMCSNLSGQVESVPDLVCHCGKFHVGCRRNQDYIHSFKRYCCQACKSIGTKTHLVSTPSYSWL